MISAMRTLLLLLTLCAATPSFADFSGRWKGTAVLTLRNGATLSCDEISLDIRQAPDRFEFGGFRYACGDYGFNFTPPRLRVEDGKVFWKDALVGAVTPTTANLLFLLANNGRARYTVALVPGGMEYLDEQIEHDPATGRERVTSIRARLYKLAALSFPATEIDARAAFDSTR